MIHQYASYIDAGCLRACAQRGVHGNALREPVFNAEALGALIESVAAAACPGARLLRHHFYDGAKNRQPSLAQSRVGKTRNFDLRLGKINVAGDQKGVDTMLAVDMALAARDGRVVDIILVGSDYDLFPGFESAKASGVRVHLIDLEVVGARPCFELAEAADTVTAWSVEQFDLVAKLADEAAPAAVDPLIAETVLVAASFADDLSESDRQACGRGVTDATARHIDWRMRKALEKRFGSEPTPEQCYAARGVLAKISLGAPCHAA